LPRTLPALTPTDVARLTKSLASRPPSGPIEEVQQQNQELLRALEDLNIRQQELVRLNRELEDTNRGVVALYAELDERADHLRRATRHAASAPRQPGARTRVRGTRRDPADLL